MGSSPEVVGWRVSHGWESAAALIPPHKGTAPFLHMGLTPSHATERAAGWGRARPAGCGQAAGELPAQGPLLQGGLLKLNWVEMERGRSQSQRLLLC